MRLLLLVRFETGVPIHYWEVDSGVWDVGSHRKIVLRVCKVFGIRRFLYLVGGVCNPDLFQMFVCMRG